jgi:serine/threonine protein kinase
VINHEEYGKPADVYSYGMVLYELLTRELPFVGMSPMKVRPPSPLAFPVQVSRVQLE